MGDADSETVIQIPAQEMEAWMDEAIGDVDEGFENLLGLVTTLNERTKSILLELKTIDCLRKVFAALNFLIVPVVTAVMLCYLTSETDSKNNHGLKAGLQSLVHFLMFTSFTVGLPLYIFAVWEYNKTHEKMNAEPNNHRLEDLTPVFDDNLLTPLSSESSLERLNDFARLLNDRMPRMMRADLLRRRCIKNDSSEQRTPHGMEDTSEMEMESAATETSASVQPSKEKQDQFLDGAEEKANAMEFPILYKFQVLMNEQSPDLAVRLEATKRGERKEAIENVEMALENDRQLAKSSDCAPTIADK